MSQFLSPGTPCFKGAMPTGNVGFGRDPNASSRTVRPDGTESNSAFNGYVRGHDDVLRGDALHDNRADLNHSVGGVSGSALFRRTGGPRQPSLASETTASPDAAGSPVAGDKRTRQSGEIDVTGERVNVKDGQPRKKRVVTNPAATRNNGGLNAEKQHLNLDGTLRKKRSANKEKALKLKAPKKVKHQNKGGESRKVGSGGSRTKKIEKPSTTHEASTSSTAAAATMDAGAAAGVTVDADDADADGHNGASTPPCCFGAPALTIRPHAGYMQMIMALDSSTGCKTST